MKGRGSRIRGDGGSGREGKREGSEGGKSENVSKQNGPIKKKKDHPFFYSLKRR